VNQRVIVAQSDKASIAKPVAGGIAAERKTARHGYDPGCAAVVVAIHAEAGEGATQGSGKGVRYSIPAMRKELTAFALTTYVSPNTND